MITKRRTAIIFISLAVFAIIAASVASHDYLSFDTVIRNWVYSRRTDALSSIIIPITYSGNVQTVADLANVPVFTATNSLNYVGHHGMALTQKTCGACAQCYLNVTGGICPIVDCTKGLVNGQCGGAKNGKCEIDPKKDCAWEKIYQRLEKQGRTKEFLDQPVQLRDYSKVNVDAIKQYVAQARAKRYEGFYGGVHPVEHKEYTEHLALQKFL